MWNSWTSTMHYQVILAVLAVTFVYATDDSNNEQKRIMSYAPFGLDELASFNNFYGLEDKVKRDTPGLLRFGKRSQMFVRLGRSSSDMEMSKKEMPGVLRFGKRSVDSMDSMPGMMRFGRSSDMDSMPGMMRFGRSPETPGLLRFGK